MIISDCKSAGGKHAESAALTHILAHGGVCDPRHGQPVTEPICFGIAGGIGAGYSFCPSVIRNGGGCGISVIGRHKIYSTDGAWAKCFAERMAIPVISLESTSPAKGHKNLIEMLETGSPVIVYTSRHELEYLGSTESMYNVGMHSFLVYGIDEENDIAFAYDIGRNPVKIPVEQLTQARNRVCSLKNRVLRFDLSKYVLTESQYASAVRSGIAATATELISGRMKTFSLPGLEMWAKVMVNDKAGDGWLRVLEGGLIYDALRNVFDSIETSGTGGGLYRTLYADFLQEAAGIMQLPELKSLADEYRSLGKLWTELAEAALPNSIKTFKQTKALLRKQSETLEKQGSKGLATIHKCVAELNGLTKAMHEDFPLSDAETRSHLNGLRERVLELHARESTAATRLGDAVIAKRLK